MKNPFKFLKDKVGSKQDSKPNVVDLLYDRFDNQKKKIHIIRSSDKVEFDKEVNLFLESGHKLMDDGYQVINDNDGVIYSQVIVFDQSVINKYPVDVSFYDNGKLEHFFTPNFLEEWCEKGVQIKWYKNGQKEGLKNWKYGKQDGLTTEWWDNGQKRVSGFDKNDKQEGLWVFWYENGQKKLEVPFKEGKQNGVMNSWYENGQKKYEGILKDGKVVELIGRWKENGSVRKEPFSWEGKYK